ncbi:MAG TPA: LysR family transcriptional regulator [Verrucomicrobiae bacterium]
MELHQLRYVVAVAKTGNFSRAAERCHVAQPSLSQQIQKLEDELGQRLFNRLKRGVKLTEAGESFLPRALRILEEVEAARREAEDTQALVRGTVTVGALPTIAPYLLPGVIAQFSRKYPGIEVVVQEDTTARLLKMTTAFEVDLAIMSLPIEENGIEVEKLFSEELLLAVPVNHGLAKKKSVKVTDLEDERFILMKEGHCLGDQVLGFCNRRNFQPNVSCRSAQMETVQALVATGLGVSLVPQMALESGPSNRPVYRSLDGTKPERAIVVIWPKKRTMGRAAKEFLSCLREDCGCK